MERGLDLSEEHFQLINDIKRSTRATGLLWRSYEIMMGLSARSKQNQI